MNVIICCKKTKNIKGSINSYPTPEKATNYINPNLNLKLKHRIIQVPRIEQL